MFIKDLCITIFVELKQDGSMKNLSLSNQIIAVLCVIAICFIPLFLLKCQPKPMPIAYDNSLLIEKLQEQISDREAYIHRLEIDLLNLEEQKAKVEYKYIPIREKVAKMERPAFQEYINEVSESTNEKEWVNLDSIGAVNIANKLIDGQVAEGKFKITDSVNQKLIAVNTQLKLNIDDLSTLYENSNNNIQQLEKALQKQKKERVWRDIGTFAVGVGVGALILK